jgi:hypothetical protein
MFCQAEGANYFGNINKGNRQKDKNGLYTERGKRRDR